MANGPRVTPEQYRDKHAKRTKAAGAEMEAGVRAVSEAPGVRAQQASDKMLAGITDAVNSGMWGRRVASVGLDEWKDKMLRLGVPRVSAGIDAAAPKVLNFATQLLAHEATLMTQVEAMPDLTLEDSISRMTTFVRGMADFEFDR